MHFRFRGFSFLAIGVCAAAWALPAHTEAQVIVQVNDDVHLRFGLLLESWADWTQDPNSAAYSQNFLIRHMRFLLDGHVGKNVSIFYQTDDARIGNSGTTGVKNICSSGTNCPTSGFITQDAFLEWKLAGDALMVDGGMFIVPSSRNVLTAASSFLGFDIGTWALQGSALEQGNTSRDHGIGLKGYLLDERFEYRVAALDGNRHISSSQSPPLGSEAGSRNSYRVAARVNYDFIDLEKTGPASAVNGYVYPGTNRGLKRVLSVGAWGDGQGSYQAYGCDFMIDWPIAKDAITVTGDYSHFEQKTSNPTLPRQGDIYAEAGYYIDTAKLQPFAVYQRLNFSDESRKAGNQRRYGGGLNWYLSGQNLKWSVYYQRIAPETKPATAKTKETNEVTVQLQAYYF